MEDKITIPLSPKQRDLLLKYESHFTDRQLFRLISIAVKKGESYEIYLNEQCLQLLVNQIAQFSYHEKDEELDSQLDVLSDYLMNIYDDSDDDEDYSEHSNNTGFVCILKIFLAGSKKIWRKIAIREGQTLHEMHNIIFEAFDRYDEHMYSFFFPHSDKKLNPRKIRQSSDEYTHPYACEDREMFDSDSEAHDASTVSIESLDLTEGQMFYYLFDFGDEWWHEITVENTDGAADKGEYPRTIEKKGKSPKQYPDPDEDEDEVY